MNRRASLGNWQAGVFRTYLLPRVGKTGLEGIAKTGASGKNPYQP
jgi:hypothetical protein